MDARSRVVTREALLTRLNEATNDGQGPPDGRRRVISSRRLDRYFRRSNLHPVPCARLRLFCILHNSPTRPPPPASLLIPFHTACYTFCWTFPVMDRGECQDVFDAMDRLQLSVCGLPWIGRGSAGG